MGPLFWAMAGKAREDQCVADWHTGGGLCSSLLLFFNNMKHYIESALKQTLYESSLVNASLRSVI